MIDDISNPHDFSRAQVKDLEAEIISGFAGHIDARNNRTLLAENSYDMHLSGDSREHDDMLCMTRPRHSPGVS